MFRRSHPRGDAFSRPPTSIALKKFHRSSALAVSFFLADQKIASRTDGLKRELPNVEDCMAKIDRRKIRTCLRIEKAYKVGFFIDPCDINEEYLWSG
jgi:hypothetical protein